MPRIRVALLHFCVTRFAQRPSCRTLRLIEVLVSADLMRGPPKRPRSSSVTPRQTAPIPPCRRSSCQILQRGARPLLPPGDDLVGVKLHREAADVARISV